MEDSSAPKRRRTSPQTSVPVQTTENANTPSAADASTPQPARRRPSFASPTKASLARSNPDILRRRSAQAPKDNASPPRSASPDPASELSIRDVTTARGPQEPLQSQNDRTTARKDGGLRNLLARTLEQRDSPAPATQPSSSGQPGSMGSPARRPPRVGGQLGAKPRRSSIRPNPRPLPPPGPEDEDFNPFARRGLNRTPPPGSQTGAPAEARQTGAMREPESSQAQAPEEYPQEEVPEVPEEPELPPTPTQKGLEDPVVTTPPTGIHNTPSKRSGRRRSDREMKSSPLKQQPIGPPDFGAPSKKKGKGKAPVPFAVEEEDVAVEEVTTRADNGTGTHFARRLPPIDPNSEKRTQRDKLRDEVAQLQVDIQFATAENARLRKLQENRRGSKHAPRSHDQDQLFDMLGRYLLPEELTPTPDASQQLFDLAMDPTSWFTLAAPALPSSTTSAKSDSPPISHHPLQMTAAEELPFLQSFTPFTMSQTTSLLPRPDPSEPLLRQHTILLASDPPSLFAAKINLVANTSTLRIHSLSVPSLDPAAKPELAPWIATICDRAANSATDHNITLLTWSMAEWQRLALQRAHFWALLAAETSDPETLLATARKTRLRRRRKRRRDDPDDEDDDELELRKAPAQADLIAHMGRTCFDVPIPDDTVGEAQWPRLRITWKIHFDWTGEGQSTVGVLAGLPGRWHNADDSKALSGLQKVFGEMARKEETPVNAVRTVIALLAGDGGRK